jgi:exopolyphosphatase/guanosine-5'-triphosphate,3'-diphosphate pyrophosphatase
MSASSFPWRAVIDLGSNTALLLIARRRVDGSIEVKRDRARLTRLSAGAVVTGRLDPAAIARTLEALRAHRQEAEECGATLTAVATEGVRIVGHPAAFLADAAEVLGTELRVISGAEEAALSYQSVAIDHAGGGRLRVIDIGGASTELIVGTG